MVQVSAASSKLFSEFLTVGPENTIFGKNKVLNCFPTTPSETLGLGCSHFARHYSGNRVCFLLLQLLRCFSSLSCLFLTYEFS